MADYTDNFNLAQPEEGSEDSGTAVNGNMEIIDSEIYIAQNPMCYEDEVLIYEDNVLFWS